MDLRNLTLRHCGRSPATQTIGRQRLPQQGSTINPGIRACRHDHPGGFLLGGRQQHTDLRLRCNHSRSQQLEITGVTVDESSLQHFLAGLRR